MPITVSLPSRNVELEFPDSMTEQEIQAAIEQEYPRSGQDVAFEVEQATQQTLEGQNLVNPFDAMSNDDYVLYRQHLAEKKTSLGDALGIAADTAGKILGEVGTGLAATGEAALAGEFGQAAESMGEGMVAGTVGLVDIADKILNPADRIPSKEEFIGKPIGSLDSKSAAFMGMGGLASPGSNLMQRVTTEADYAALIEQEKARDKDAANRLFAMEATLQGAPIEEVARAFQYVDPTMLAGGASALIKAGAKTLFKKGAARTGAQTAAAVADAVTPPPAGAFQTIESGGTMFAAPTPGVSTAPGRLGQAALGVVETGAGAVQAVASAPGRLVDAVGNVVERVMPGTSAPLKAAAATTAMLGDAGLTAGTIAGLKTTEKTAEVAAAAARAARGEASRAGLLERVAQSPNVSTSARKLAEGLAQIQPAIGVAKRVTAQALKEGAAGAAVGAGLGYLAERNLEGAAAGAGAGTAFGGMFGAMRGTFRAGREALGYSTERTARQATGDINRFIAERPEIEQGAWAATMSRLAEKIGPEKAAAQVDALRIAEANGGKVRVATPDEVKQWQNPGWMNVDGLEIVLNPQRILSDTAAHEATHVLFASTLNRAFKTDIENAIYGAVDPVSGEVVRPGLFTDPDLARIADQIADSYGNNTTAANEFRGYANRLRNTTDPTALSEARTRVADELTATYSGKLFGRLRAGRFNPDRLPLVYRRVLNSIEDGIVEKLRTTLFEQGMDLGFNAARGAFTDSKGRPVRIPELDAIIKKAMQPKRQSVPEAKAKPDLIPVNPVDRAVWSRSYGGARGILNEDDTPKSLQQIDAEANARWQDMTSRLSALPENERIGLDFTRDDKGKTVMTAKGQISDAAINAILSSDTLDQSAKATLREVLMSMKNFDKATFDTRYYGVYTRGRGTNKMVAGVKSASQNEILPYSVEMNSKDGVIIRAVDMTKVRDRLMIALKKPQFKDLYGNPADALKDFRSYLTNLTNISAIPSETVLGGGVRGAQKRNLFYDALGFRLRNNETLLNVPAEVISKSKNTLKSYRAERFAKLVDSGERFAFEEGTTYERAMKNFQPDAFAKETLPNAEAMTNPDGYRILKQTGGKLFRVYDDKGELIGTASTETAAMKKAQSDAAKKVNQQAKKPSIIEAPPVMREFPDGYKLTQPGLIRFQPVRGYHGTPHKIPIEEGFRMEKVGTGEGVQAYGYGLYFAGAKKVAEGYRKNLSRATLNGVDAREWLRKQPDSAMQLARRDNIDIVAASKKLEEELPTIRAVDAYVTYGDNAIKMLKRDKDRTELKRLLDEDSLKSEGNLYTVDLLPDEANFLDWDKPLSEQSDSVKAFMDRVAEKVPFDGIIKNSDGTLEQDASGRMLYEWLTKQQKGTNREFQVSDLLNKNGIPGIKYLDAGSRSAGEGSRNYVIFDDKLVKIIEENGKPVGEPTSTKRFQANPPEQTTAVPDFSKVSKKDKPILEVIYFKNQDKFKEAVAQGRIQKGVPIEKFQDMAIALHQPDSAMVGDVVMRGNKVVTSQGGVYYPVLFGDKGSLWASTENAANGMAVELNKISSINNGKILMALTSAPIDKMLSSSNIANGTMTLLYNVSQLPREYGISRSVANKILVDAVNTPLVVETNGKKTIIKFDERLKSSTPIEENMAIITRMLEPEQSTFPLRKHFVQNIAKSIASHLSKNQRASKEFASLIVPESNKYANRAIIKGSLSQASIIQALGDLFSEEFTKDFQGISNPGGVGGYIYAILEMDGEVESVQTKQHGSYTHSINSTSGKQPKVHILEKPIKWTDTLGLIQTRDYVPASIKDSVYPPSIGFAQSKQYGNLMVMKPKETALTGGEITRFQPDTASPSILNGSNGTRIIKSPSGKFRVYSATGTLLGIRDTEQAAKKLATK